MTEYQIHCPGCQLTFDVTDDLAGAQTQCPSCSVYFSIPTRAQVSMISPIGHSTQVPSYIPTPKVPKWYQSLTTIGPITALVLVIGGGTTYWVVNNKRVEKTITTNTVEIVDVVEDKVVPIVAVDPEPALALHDPVKLPPPIPEPEPPKSVPAEVPLRFALYAVDPVILKTHPNLGTLPSSKIHDIITQSVESKDGMEIYNEVTIAQSGKKAMLEPDREMVEILREYQSAENGVIMRTRNDIRNLGMAIEFNYLAKGNRSGVLDLIFQNVSKSNYKRPIPSGGDGGWFFEPKGSRVNVRQLNLLEESPLLAGTFYSDQKILQSPTDKKYLYLLFVTLEVIKE